MNGGENVQLYECQSSEQDNSQIPYYFEQMLTCLNDFLLFFQRSEMKDKDLYQLVML